MYVEAQAKRGIQVTIKPQQNDPQVTSCFSCKGNYEVSK